jgi:hypothetical protein
VRTAALLSAVTGLAGIGVLAGVLTGDLTQPDVPTAAGAPKPLLSIPSPSPTPTRVEPLPDPTTPPPLDPGSLDYTARTVPGTSATIRLRAPEAWELIVLRYDAPLEGRFRERGENGTIYHLRAEDMPDTLTPDRASKQLEAILRGNGTADLRILKRGSGTVTEDGLTRRYSELAYTYTEIKTRRSLLVILRWINGVELSATGRKMDRDGLEAVIEEATETAEVTKA